MAHELDELIPHNGLAFGLCYHRILFTQMLGNHVASEAYPLVDAGRSRLIRRKSKVERNEDFPQSRSLEKPRRSWIKALEVLLGFESVITLAIWL